MKLTEEELRKITINAIAELGDRATPDKVKEIVEKAVASVDTKSDFTTPKDSGRVILTAFGLNKPGIISAITAKLAETKCDIQDLSQKLMEEFFTVIMTIDISSSPNDMSEIQKAMQQIADELNIKIYTQHEDIFRAMHRV